MDSYNLAGSIATGQDVRPLRHRYTLLERKKKLIPVILRPNMTNFQYKGAFWLSVVKKKTRQSEERKISSRANKISKKKKHDQNA